jgi:hypothetical protein
VIGPVSDIAVLLSVLRLARTPEGQTPRRGGIHRGTPGRIVAWLGFYRMTSRAPGVIRRVRVGKKVVLMDLSRTEFIKLLRHAGLNDVADAAEATLPNPVDAKTLNDFCTAQGVSLSMLTDRMGASP